jgi:uncharacterized protein (DUF433 family)
MNQGSGIPETTSRTAWKSSAPWAIVDWSRSGATLTVVLKNNSYESLDFERLTVGASDYNNTKTSDIAPGATLTKTIDISGGSSCTQGTRYSIPQNAIYVDFNTTTISGRRQTATADIIGTC